MINFNDIARVKDIFIAAIIGTLLGAGVGGYGVKCFVTNKYERRIAEEKAAEAIKVQNETAKILERERIAKETSTKLELENQSVRKEITSLYDENRELAARIGGLRDPYRKANQCPTNTGSAASRNSPNSADSALLSEEATRFLLKLTREADESAAYAQSCYRWVKALQEDKAASK